MILTEDSNVKPLNLSNMGMDIYGLDSKFETLRPKEPTTDFNYEAEDWKEYYEALNKFKELPGTYYRSNMWWWRPIVFFLEDYADDILTPDDIHGMSVNSGYVIDAVKARLLGDRLTLAIQEGYIKQWVKTYTENLYELPDEDCYNCNATGFTNGDPCRICDTKGKVPNFKKNYPTNEEVFDEFTEFVNNSGGFEVW
jgi:hypothetical protein